MQVVGFAKLFFVALDYALNFGFEALDRLRADVLDTFLLPFLLAGLLACQPSFLVLSHFKIIALFNLPSRLLQLFVEVLLLSEHTLNFLRQKIFVLK